MTIDSKDRRAALLRAVAAKKAAPAAESHGIPPRPPEQPAELSGLQRSLWLLHRLEPQSAAYNLVSAFRVKGRPDYGRLERALAECIDRHRILRSTFSPQSDSATQVIHEQPPGGPVRVERIGAEPGKLIETAQREARRPFDLERGPLVRAFAVDDGSEQAVVLVLHHILADERSLLFLWEEIAAVYNGVAPPPAAEAQYDDYVAWQARQEDAEREEDLGFWRENLTPPPGDLALPFGRGAQLGSNRGELILYRPAPETCAGVRELAAQTRTTPFAVYALAYRRLLERTAVSSDWAYATPAARRLHPDAGRMIGYFLNPVVVTTSIDESLPVEEALRAIAGDLRESIARASIPFDRLADEFAPARRGRAPLFQTMFVHQEEHPPPALDGVSLEPLTLDLGESKFDLTLFVSEGSSSLELGVEYRTELFDRVWMERLLRRYEALLGGLAEQPGRRLAEVSEIPREEAAELRAWSTGEPLDHASAPLLPLRILERTADAAQQPAVISGGSAWSYADLGREARRIAANLVRRGVGHGDRVGLYVGRSPEMIAGLVGALWSGAAYVPLDPAYPSERTAAALADAEARAVVTTRTLEPQLSPEGFARTLVDDLPASEESFVPVEPAPDDPAYLLYTSGSSGKPKGVVVTHANLRASEAARERSYGDPPKRFLLLSSVAFDSSVAGIFWALSSGGALVVPSDDEARDPRRLAQLIEQHQIDALLCVPSLYRHILAEGGAQVGSLRTVIVAGEACPAGLVAQHFRAAPGARLFNEYGPTEASVWATVEELRRGDGEQEVSIGRPIPGVVVQTIDAHGRPTPAGVPGEGWISGPTVADGYWRRPDLTAERFSRHTGPDGAPTRAYRTGDRLVWNERGRLRFLGRVDNQIKLRGFRIEPEEIEAALQETPGVEEAVVVVRRTQAGEQLTAFLRGSAPADELRSRLAGRLPDYMIPGRFVALDELPRLPNGKADRRRLAEMDLTPEAPSPRRDEILSERKHALVSLWEGLLGVSGIGRADNFFQLGGHSLLVVRMAAALERDFGVEISPAELFQHPTIDEIDRLLDQRRRADAPRYRNLFPLQPGGDGAPLIFCIPHFFSDLYSQRFRGVRPVYGLRGVGIRPGGNRGLWPSMEALGEELAAETLRRFPDEREFSVAGYSFGASMAFELTRVLEQRGIAVRDLQLIAPMPLDFYRVGPLRIQLEALRKPLAKLSRAEAFTRFLRDNGPWKARPYQRLRRHLVTTPRRRLLCLAGDLRKRRGRELTPEILHADVRLERFRLHSRYEPGVVQAPTVVFNAREPETDAAATWRPHFGGEFEVIEIADPHLNDDAVEAARARVLDYLRERSGS